ERVVLDRPGNPHRPSVVAEVALELAEDAGDGEGGEADTALGVEAVDRVDQPDARHLLEVLQRDRLAAVAVGEPTGQRQEALDQLSSGRPVAEPHIALKQATLAGRL